MLRRPATATVANLVDMDNILPCQVEHCGQELVVRLSGDALYILNESSLLRRQPLITAKGKVVGIIPGVGAYKIRIETGCLSSLVRVPREQTIGLTLGSNVEVAFNPEEVQLV